jgi:hypothetical protein
MAEIMPRYLKFLLRSVWEEWTAIISVTQPFLQCLMSQSVSPQVLVKTETIANLARIVERVNSVPQEVE